MGCSASRLEDAEAVQLCRDRKNFIKQAIEQRKKFALGHIAYIQSLRRVSAALHRYVDGDEQQHSDFMSDTYSTPPFTPIKRLSPETGRIPFQYSSPLKSIQFEKCVSQTAHYLRSDGNTTVSVEERPSSPETMRINSFYNYHHNSPMEQMYGMEGIFGMQPPPSPKNQSFFPPSPYNRSLSPYHRTNYLPPSPSSSQWDFFWNPFASLESYGYPGYNSLNRVTSIDEMAGLRQVREEEGIPDLEEEDDDEEEGVEGVNHSPTRPVHVENKHAAPPVETNPVREDDNNKAKENKNNNSSSSKTIEENETKQRGEYEVKKLQSRDKESSNFMKARDGVKLELADEKGMVGGGGALVQEAGTPGFTAYVDRRATSMSEVMRNIEHQFMRICDFAHEVSVMLEASRAHFSCNSSELSAAAIKMLNLVTLFHSASSHSSSSRFLQTPPPSSLFRDDSYETSSDISEESSCLVSGSHQSTLDRLYAWEKKLYEEVKSGERIRKAYAKKCMQLKNQDVTAENHGSMDKMRRIERDLQTQIKVSIHSIEAISRRIEMLRDEELHPQMMELLQGLGRMWRTMAECHQIQKRVIDEAKLLLATPKLADRPPPATRLARSATNLEAELRNWRSCLQTWIAAQRSYAHTLTGWLLCCAPPPEEPQTQRSPLSPPRSSGEPPIFQLCIHWSRMVESVSEAQAVEGLDFFAAGVASVVAQQREVEEARRRAMARGAVAEMAEEEEEEKRNGKVHEKEKEVASPEKIAEVGVRVVCAGMSVAITGLAELAVKSMEGCEDLARTSSPPPSI